jgi:hypothetical protein
MFQPELSFRVLLDRRICEGDIFRKSADSFFMQKKLLSRRLELAGSRPVTLNFNFCA